MLPVNNNVERRAFSISEFCIRRGISLTAYYKLRNAGFGPREMLLGATIRISIEAEEDWRRDREMPGDTEARLVKREREARSQAARKAALVAVKSGNHISTRNRAKRGR